jgi:NAD(P)-dependent dehydrogenase (short-subunit alcohol dehydrogenase family)
MQDGGALPYATAKAAVEGLTRAVAVDHGPDGIRAILFDGLIQRAGTGPATTGPS